MLLRRGAIAAELKGKARPPFVYRDYGSLATIGRKNAVVQMGGMRVSGFLAWLIWCLAHIYFLIGFRNRLVVILNWAWNSLTFARGARLITGLTGSRMEDMPAPAGSADLPITTDRVRAA